MDLDAIRRRVEAATPGPWTRVWPEHDDGGWSVWTRSGNPFKRVCWLGNFPNQDHDADFIAHAITDISELLDRVVELEHRIWPDQGHGYANEVERQRAVIEMLQAGLTDAQARIEGLESQIEHWREIR